MIIKVLFAIFVLSAAALVGAAVAAFVRVWWHLKSRRARTQNLTEAVQESSSDISPGSTPKGQPRRA